VCVCMCVCMCVCVCELTLANLDKYWNYTIYITFRYASLSNCMLEGGKG